VGSVRAKRRRDPFGIESLYPPVPYEKAWNCQTDLAAYATFRLIETARWLATDGLLSLRPNDSRLFRFCDPATVPRFNYLLNS
jgi:hypothetical protein